MLINKQQSNKKNQNSKTKSGFAILFAVLLSSFLITLGISIFNISLKEIQIVTSQRDSLVAYYAADSARECANYWDAKQAAFPVCFLSDCSNSVSVDITCNGATSTLTFTPTGTTFASNIVKDAFNYSSTTNDILPVSDLQVIKSFVNSNVVTTINTWGHNTTVVGRRVERGISQTHN